jgi:hypothetical protein
VIVFAAETIFHENLAANLLLCGCVSLSGGVIAELLERIANRD